jgi:type II secretory ATPase GspE/PulE/Tfp pilus assembly ATPase PilB-like protein
MTLPRPIPRIMEAAPHPWPAIGSLILRDGYVTKEELDEILRAQHDAPEHRLSGWRLGEILVERGLMTQGQVARLVAEQYELPYLELEASAIDRTVVDLLPRDLADRFAAVPVEIASDGALVLAVADPAAVLFSDELRRALGRPLRFVVVAQDALEAARAVLRGESSADPPSLSLASWPSGAPAFDFPAESAEAGLEATNGTAAASATSCPPLGTLLVRDGLVTEDELEAALAEQRLSGEKRLGEILVERGTLTRADVARVVAEQYELEYVDLNAMEIDHRVAALLPFDIASRYGALPLDFLPDGSLRLAVADPTRVLAPEEILAVLGARLTFAVADPDLVEAALEDLREHSAPSAGSWPSLASIGPPLTGTQDHPHVDASDLIIVPADELASVEREALERRGEPSGESDGGLVSAAAEATPVDSELTTLEPLVRSADEAIATGDEQPAAPAAEADSASTKTKRRRGWFRRKRSRDDDARADTASPAREALDEPAADESPAPDPIAGLLLAGEAADDADTLGAEPSARATDQAAVLRLWIAGDDAPAPAIREDVAELDAPTERTVHAADELAAEAEIAADPAAASAADTTSEVTLDDEPATEAPVPLEPLDDATGDAPALDGDETLGEAQAAEVWNIFDPAAASAADTTSEVTLDDAPATEAPVQLEPLDEATSDAPALDGDDAAATPRDAPEDEPGEETRVEVALAEAAGAETTDGTFGSDRDASFETDARLDGATDDAGRWEEPMPSAWERAPEVGAAEESQTAAAEAEETEAVATEEPTDAAQAAELTDVVHQPSWLSWEPSEDVADPWRADLDPDADAEREEHAEPEVEPEPAPEQGALVEPTLSEAEAEDDSWLAEIEPDSPEDTAAPWELENAPAVEAEPELAESRPVPAASWGDPSEPAEDAALDAAPTLTPLGAPAPEIADGGVLAPIVERAVGLGASTVHFSAQEHGIVVRARIDGVLRKLDTVSGQPRFELARELGLAAQAGTLADGHVTALPTPHGETVTVRFRAGSSATTLETLTLEPADREAIERALRQPFGLVLVAGPSGSGTQDTLSAALHELASSDRAVMTIEDPIVQVVPGADQVAVDHSAGRGYADGLRTILAADPDAVLVGELADEETARLAVDAATGHLVVTTVLAQSAVGAIDRLSLLGVDADLVASTLALVVSQRLVRRLCDHCREGYYATPADAAALRRPDEEIGRRLLARGTGCAECGHTGFSGTIGVYEVLTPNDEVRALIAANASAAEVERAARLAGKRTLSDDAVRLVLDGLTTVSEIQRVLGRAL